VPEVSVHLVLVYGTPLGGTNPFFPGLSSPAAFTCRPFLLGWNLHLQTVDIAPPVKTGSYLGLY